jgi:serine/threonine protein kinase/Tol biopolymer transport system component
VVGDTVGHYRVLKLLGCGGMGEVFLAEDTRLRRQVALKSLPPVVGGQPERLDRFEREAQTLAALNHPHIVTVYAVEQFGDTRFLAMEYVDGQTLADLMPKGGLPLRRLLVIARQIVDAVIAAHERGIIHRDLKPANVMVAPGDRVKVLDFGLAKLRDGAESASESTALTREASHEGKIVGTVAYMSPEQAEGRSVDQRSDIFSLGVMLYELAAGVRPFTGDTSLSVLSAILRDTPKPITDLNRAQPRELARIVRRCLMKDSERRYQSAKDLRNDLDELEQTLNSGELDRLPKPAASGPSRVAVAIVAAATVAVGAAAVIWWRPTGPRQTSSPTVLHSRLTQAAGIEQFPAIAPDGKWVVYSKNGDIFLQSVTGQRAINLTNDAASLNIMPAFSPDGEQIAFRSNRSGGGIFVMGRMGESVRRITDRGWYPAWFPDSRRIVFSTDGPPGPEALPVSRSALMTADAGGSDPKVLVSGYYAAQPRVSPHGRRIAFWAIRPDQKLDRYNRDVWTVNVDGSGPVRATDHPAIDWNPVWSPDGTSLYFLSNRGGSMNLWRVAIDEATGRTAGSPEPLTAPAPYVAYFSLSADGRVGAYLALTGATNIGHISFDPERAVATGAATGVTTGAHDFYGGSVDVTRDGRLVVASTLLGQEDLYLVSTADGAIRQLTNDVFRDRAPRWLNDNRRILFYSDRSGEYEVWSIDADGGSLRQLTPNGGWRGYPVPSPDGSRIVTDDIETHRLFVYDARDFSKPIEALPPNPDASVVNLTVTSWSPDGSRILYSTPGSARSGVWMFSWADRSHQRLVDGTQGAWLQDSHRFIYNDAGRLKLFDISTHTAHDVLAIDGEAVTGPRLALNDTELFFLRGTSDGDVWLVRLGDK